MCASCCMTTGGLAHGHSGRTAGAGVPSVALRTSTCCGGRGGWHRKLPARRCVAYWRARWLARPGWRGGSLPLLLLLPGLEKGRREDASNRGTARHTYGTAPPRPAPPRPGPRHGPHAAQLFLRGVGPRVPPAAARVCACYSKSEVITTPRGGGRACDWQGGEGGLHLDRGRGQGSRTQGPSVACRPPGKQPGVGGGGGTPRHARTSQHAAAAAAAALA